MDITFRSGVDVELIQYMGSDDMVAHAARVSTKGIAEDPFERVSADKLGGLINYLMKQRHGTPFECGAMTVRVHAPIFVWREWHRH